MDFRLIFANESKISIESFINNKIPRFFDALNNFVAKISTDYDTNLDPVDPNDVVNTDEDGPDPIN